MPVLVQIGSLLPYRLTVLLSLTEGPVKDIGPVLPELWHAD